MIGGLVAVLVRHVREIVRRKVHILAAVAAAAASLLFSFVFALVALRHWLAVSYGAQHPDLWIAVGFLGAALIAGATGLLISQREPPANPALDVALLAGVPAARFAVSRLSPRVVAVGVVLVAGLMVGRRLAKRQAD